MAMFALVQKHKGKDILCAYLAIASALTQQPLLNQSLPAVIDFSSACCSLSPPPLVHLKLCRNCHMPALPCCREPACEGVVLSREVRHKAQGPWCMPPPPRGTSAAAFLCSFQALELGPSERQEGGCRR